MVEAKMVYGLGVNNQLGCASLQLCNLGQGIDKEDHKRSKPLNVFENIKV